MCMVIREFHQRFKRIAMKPMTVYKVMKTEDPNGFWGRINGKKLEANPDVILSPFQMHVYVLGEMQEAKIKKETKYSVWNDKTSVVIENGIHSFVELNDAIKEARRASKDDLGYIYSVYECVIPRWTDYYVGYWGYIWAGEDIKNVVSSKLTITKQIYAII